MDKKYEKYSDLAERVSGAFPEIDNDVCMELRRDNREYVEMGREIIRLQADFPAIALVTEGKGAVSLSEEEHEALSRYLDLKIEMENAERRRIYFRGHTDNYAFLKEIAGVHLD